VTRSGASAASCQWPAQGQFVDVEDTYTIRQQAQADGATTAMVDHTGLEREPGPNRCLRNLPCSFGIPR